MNIHQFCRNNRTSENRISDIVINTITDVIPELTEYKFLDKITKSTSKNSTQTETKAIIENSSDSVKEFGECASFITINLGLLHEYLSEDSDSVITQISEGKIKDPYVQCVVISIAERLFEVESSTFLSILRYIESSNDVNRRTWIIVKNQIKASGFTQT